MNRFRLQLQEIESNIEAIAGANLDSDSKWMRNSEMLCSVKGYLHSLNLDDNLSWNNDYPFIGRGEFEDINICYAVHNLTDHLGYSIPDLIRLNDFWAEVRLTVQSITEQDGTRYIPSTL